MTQKNMNICLYSGAYNVKINNFSVMLGPNNHFLGMYLTLLWQALRWLVTLFLFQYHKSPEASDPPPPPPPPHTHKHRTQLNFLKIKYRFCPRPNRTEHLKHFKDVVWDIFVFALGNTHGFHLIRAKVCSVFKLKFALNIPYYDYLFLETRHTISRCHIATHFYLKACPSTCLNLFVVTKCLKHTLRHYHIYASTNTEGKHGKGSFCLTSCLTSQSKAKVMSGHCLHFMGLLPKVRMS